MKKIVFLYVLLSCIFIEAKTLMIRCESSEESSIFDDFYQKISNALSWNIRIWQKSKHVHQVDNASYINRLQPDFFLMLRIIIDAQKSSSCSVYSFAWNKTDSWPKQSTDLSFTPFYTTHTVHAHQTAIYAQSFLKLLCTSALEQFDSAYYQCPYKPLEGILCPAFSLEIVLPSLEYWKKIEHIFIKNIALLLL